MAALARAPSTSVHSERVRTYHRCVREVSSLRCTEVQGARAGNEAATIWARCLRYMTVARIRSSSIKVILEERIQVTEICIRCVRMTVVFARHSRITVVHTK